MSRVLLGRHRSAQKSRTPSEPAPDNTVSGNSGDHYYYYYSYVSR